KTPKSEKEGRPVPIRSIMRSIWNKWDRDFRICETVPDPVKHPDYHLCNPATRSEAAVRLKINDRSLGILNVESYKPGYFKQKDQQSLLQLAEWISIALQMATKQMHLQGFAGSATGRPIPSKIFLKSILEQ